MKYTAIYARGMNTRPDHNVNNSPNGAVPYNTPTEIVEVWEALSDGLNVRKGDKWARLASSTIQWVAVVHMGNVYGKVENETVPVPPEPTPVPEPTTPKFPASFTLTDPSGNKAEYRLVRVL